jgi:hypothetical protein
VLRQSILARRSLILRRFAVVCVGEAAIGSAAAQRLRRYFPDLLNNYVHFFQQYLAPFPPKKKFEYKLHIPNCRRNHSSQLKSNIRLCENCTTTQSSPAINFPFRYLSLSSLSVEGKEGKVLPCGLTWLERVEQFQEKLHQHF